MMNREKKMAYDSANDTQAHIEEVQRRLDSVVAMLAHRRAIHDLSKLESPEKEMYDKYTPLLRGLTYGSDEYKKTLADMGPALQHHYAHNSHHPEHYPNGIDGMSLLDIIEMLADWKAAGMRHADGNMSASMEINRKRFGISEQLFKVLENTIKEMGW